ncbi:hypothetical protein [Celeribacter indicus]|uniref:O-antigen polymerase n=1 Tax=Celeribacter indicus TaxID=1208324 RepID=A0A0B5DUT4_9RHOB|nr:hypothetical protein [Celeribacter indicus]AJE47158.1 hypothetical protein P73_2443 [Celeribacter indicus]SDX58877.1 hypothetical protein SAMN05443573_1475 [Celeribacter indicus]
MKSRPTTLLFTLYIVLAPLYLLPSGMPQPADFLVPIGIAFILLTGRRIAFPTARARSFLLVTFVFFVWVLVVSVVNSLMSGLTDILMAPAFGMFNFMLVLLGFAALQHLDYPDKLIAKALTVSAVVMFTGLLLTFSGSSSRQTAMFNNPNQLAYFSILVLGGLILASDRPSLLRLRFAMPAAMLVISNLVAASLTGYAALALLGGAWSLKVGARRLFLIVFFGLTAALLAPSLFLPESHSQVFEIVSNRFLLLDDKLDGGIAERGYDRIYEFPQYLLFGAGEGGLSRFGIEAALELHSTFGTLLFSYGIIGLLLFLSMIWIAARGATLVELAVLAAPLAYSVTHHGFRFSAFWLFITIFLMTKEKRTMRLSTPILEQPVSRPGESPL